MRPQDCTIDNVSQPFAGSADASKAGEIHVTLSDGSVFRSAGPIESNEDGVVVVRIGLTPLEDGTEAIVGPIVDDRARALFAAIGVTLPAPQAPEILKTGSGDAPAAEEKNEPATPPSAAAAQADVPEEASAATPPIATPITHTIAVETLSQAESAPMTQRTAPDTHVVVHNDAIGVLHRLLQEAKDGIDGAFETLEQAFAHVFHHGKSS